MSSDMLTISAVLLLTLASLSRGAGEDCAEELLGATERCGTVWAYWERDCAGQRGVTARVACTREHTVGGGLCVTAAEEYVSCLLWAEHLTSEVIPYECNRSEIVFPSIGLQSRMLLNPYDDVALSLRAGTFAELRGFCCHPPGPGASPEVRLLAGGSGLAMAVRGGLPYQATLDLLQMPPGCIVARTGSRVSYSLPAFDSLGPYARFEAGDIFGQPRAVPCMTECAPGTFSPACAGLGARLFDVDWSGPITECVGSCAAYAFHRLAETASANGVSCSQVACDTREPRCASLTVGADWPSLVGATQWDVTYPTLPFAERCAVDGTWECQTCPSGRLPPHGRYSAKFYGESRITDGRVYSLQTVLGEVSPLLGEGACEAWIGCEVGYVYQHGHCLSCDGVTCPPGTTCSPETVRCEPGADRVCAAGHHLVGGECLSCPPDHFCEGGAAGPVPCPGGTSTVGLARGPTDCLGVNFATPALYPLQPQAYLVWETVGCSTFRFAAETVRTVMQAFGVDGMLLAPSLTRLCSATFNPDVNPEFLQHLPCVCRTIPVGADEEGLALERVVPKRLHCPSGHYLVSGGKPGAAERVPDNGCLPCPSRREAECAAGFYSPLCREGMHYLEPQFYDVIVNATYHLARHVLKEAASPTLCTWPCPRDQLRAFEYFSGEGTAGDCTRGTCRECSHEAAEPYTAAHGFTKAFYATRCDALRPTHLQCASCRTTLPTHSREYNADAIIFYHGVNYAPANLSGWECEWGCKPGFKKLRAGSVHVCERCGNVTSCPPGYYAALCAEREGPDLTPLCEPCRPPRETLPAEGGELSTGLGVEWDWALDRECAVSCRPGFHLDARGTCRPCPEGSTCAGGLSPPERCPDGSWTTTIAQITCVACPAGSYCGGDHGIRECSAFQTSPEGSHLARNCSCAAGTILREVNETGAAPFICTPCPPAHFCESQDTVTACPDGHDSMPGASRPEQCTPLVTACPEMHFPEDGLCRPCPAGAVWAGGNASGVEACDCAAGHFRQLDASLQHTEAAYASAACRVAAGSLLVARGGTQLVLLREGTAGALISLVVAGAGAGAHLLPSEGSLLAPLFTAVSAVAVSPDTATVWVADAGRGILRVHLSRGALARPHTLQPRGTCTLLRAVAGVGSLVVNRLGSFLLYHTAGTGAQVSPLEPFSASLGPVTTRTLLPDTGDARYRQLLLTHDEQVVLLVRVSAAGTYFTFYDMQTGRANTERQTAEHVGASRSLKLAAAPRKNFWMVTEERVFNMSLRATQQGWSAVYAVSLHLPPSFSRNPVLFVIADVGALRVFRQQRAPHQGYSEKVQLLSAACLRCPDGHASPPGAVGPAACLKALCPANHWCADGAVRPCPNGTISAPGMGDRVACSCPDGTGLMLSAPPPSNVTQEIQVRGTWDYFRGPSVPRLGRPGGRRCSPTSCERKTIWITGLHEANIFLLAESQFFYLNVTAATVQHQLGTIASKCSMESFSQDVLHSPFCLGFHVSSPVLDVHASGDEMVYALGVSFAAGSYLLQLQSVAGHLNTTGRRLRLSERMLHMVGASDHRGLLFLLRKDRRLLVVDAVRWRVHTSQVRHRVGGTVALLPATSMAIAESRYPGSIYMLFTSSWDDTAVRVSLLHSGDQFSISDLWQVSLPSPASGVSAMALSFESPQTPPSYVVVSSHEGGLYFIRLSPGGLSVAHVLSLGERYYVESMWVSPLTSTLHFIASDGPGTGAVTAQTVAYATLQWQADATCATGAPTSMFTCPQVSCLDCEGGFGALGVCFECPPGAQPYLNVTAPTVEGWIPVSFRRNCISTSARHWRYTTSTTSLTAEEFRPLLVAACQIRHDTSDTLLSCLLISGATACVMVYNLVQPVHDNHVRVECGNKYSLVLQKGTAVVEEASGVGALVTSGFLHVYPMTVLYCFQSRKEGVKTAFLLSLGLHALVAVLVCLAPGRVWVSVLLQHSYEDMLVGGVSNHELSTLVTQTTVLLATAVTTFWMMIRMVRITGGEMCPFISETALITLLVSVSIACLLLCFDFYVLVIVYSAVTALVAGMQFVFSAQISVPFLDALWGSR